MSRKKQLIQFEGHIDSNGNTHVPEKFREFYGQKARFVILDEDSTERDDKTIDPMKYSGQLDWPIDGLALQRASRNEWE